MAQPTVAPSVPALLAASGRHGAPRAGSARHRRRGGPARAGHARPGLDGHLQRRPGDRRGGALDGLGGLHGCSGAPSASIHELYMARGRGEVGGFTVPAINLRTQVFEMAAASSARRSRARVGAVIMELARSEQEYTFQRPGEFITNVLAGALASGWHGPVFVQGDHYQFNAKKYAADPAAVTEGLRKLTREAWPWATATSTSTPRRWSISRKPSVDEQQRTNYARAAELTALIRQHGAGGPDDQRRRRDRRGRQGELDRAGAAGLPGWLPGRARPAWPARRAIGVSKVSVQTGTSHGGIPLPDGSVAPVKLDFGTLERLGAVARQIRPRGRGPARRLDPARRALPSLPGGRDGRDPPRHRLPEPALRASRLPRRPEGRDRGLVRLDLRR